MYGICECAWALVELCVGVHSPVEGWYGPLRLEFIVVGSSTGMSKVRGLGSNSQSVQVCEHLLPSGIGIAMRIVGLRFQREVRIKDVDVGQGSRAVCLPLLQACLACRSNDLRVMRVSAVSFPCTLRVDHHREASTGRRGAIAGPVRCPLRLRRRRICNHLSSSAGVWTKVRYQCSEAGCKPWVLYDRVDRVSVHRSEVARRV